MAFYTLYVDRKERLWKKIRRRISMMTVEMTVRHKNRTCSSSAIHSTLPALQND